MSCERRTRGGRSFALWSLAAAQPKAPLLGAAYAALSEELRSLLTDGRARGAVGVRVILRAYSGRIIHRVAVLANRPWPEANALLAAHGWPRVDGYESLRHFELWLPD